MTATSPDSRTGGSLGRPRVPAGNHELGEGSSPRLARWLSLAATPTFAGMALLTSAVGASPMDALCSTGHGSALDGMVPMYLLMSVFHAAPWLKVLGSLLAARARPRNDCSAS